MINTLSSFYKINLTELCVGVSQDVLVDYFSFNAFIEIKIVILIVY